MSTHTIQPADIVEWQRAAEFRVSCVPVAQPRQRHKVIRGGGRTIVANYTPTRDPVNVYKSMVMQASRAAYDGAPLAGPLRVGIVFVFDRPAYLLKPRSPDARVLCGKKPDSDNLLKSTFDALNKLLWVDDSQVCTVIAEKFFRSRAEQPHVEITVWQVGK